MDQVLAKNLVGPLAHCLRYHQQQQQKMSVLSNAAVRNDVQQISLRSTGISAIAEILRKTASQAKFH